MTAWDFFKANCFEKAVEGFSCELEEAPCTPSYNNRGLAYLHLGKFDQALADFRAANEISTRNLNTETDGDLCGVALWLAGREEEATMVWAAGTKAMLAGRIKYTDNAGGVGIGCLLWFASIRLNRSDMRELAEKLLVKKIKARRSEFWPGPLGRYILGQIAEDELRAKMTEAPILRDREACEAEFYIGTTALAAGDKARYFREMNLAVEFGKGTMIDAEYYLARHECSI